jgi:hypothetical protein
MPIFQLREIATYSIHDVVLLKRRQIPQHQKEGDKKPPADIPDPDRHR